MTIPSYPSVFAVGHRAVDGLLAGEIVIEEKVDGSQFSFYQNEEGIVHLRSKGRDQTHAPDALFSVAAEVVQGLELRAGWIYRAEYLRQPKHNTLKYNRVPEKHLALFDVEVPVGLGYRFLSPEDKQAEAARLGLDVVPTFFQGRLTPTEVVELVAELLKRESFLGGPLIEGVVIKNYDFFTHEKKVGIAKFVSEEFKEKHKVAWKNSNPSRGDLIQTLIETYKTEPRWRKAIQHLRERGELQDAPQDIGPLLREVQTDILEEYGEEIKETLFKHFWKDISRGVTAGLPEWYKQQLVERIAA